MTATATSGVHPILACAGVIADALKDVSDVQPTFMSPADKKAALLQIAANEAAQAELRLRVLASSDDVADETGARDAAAWVSHATRADPLTARADLHLAKALEDRPLVAAGMREGQVSQAQARVIVAGLDALPDEVGPDVTASAERELVGYAADFRPKELRRLARHILDVVAPEIADEEAGRQLEAEERRAREKASLRFRDLGDGRTRVWGVLPTAVAERLKVYLQAFTSPRSSERLDTSLVPRDCSTNLRQDRAYAWALAALLEALDPDNLPEHGGDATTVIVTMTLEQLRAELAAAGLLSGGEEISASEARRLACQAQIIPAVLGGRSEVLELGRSQRLASRAQRKALRLRDRGCRAEGCTVPAAWTEAHHLKPWSEGGKTDLNDLISFCNHDHHKIHDPAYTHEFLANGDVRFHRRR
ncbi:MAG: DUF222 domain-containing protein [Propionibacteriales bacterium]|nr:DUF222 domain-containing protein [Propionibacteriales bacterium]